MAYQLTIRPRDVLFFRDARPMGGSYEGAGGQWPLPTTFHAALQSALYREWPDLVPEWESKHTHLTDKERSRQTVRKSALRFGGLKTSGPFPSRNGTLFFPTPSDVHPDGVLAPLQAPDGSASNLPRSLEYPVGIDSAATKVTVHPWISDHELARYLSGAPDAKTTCAGDLYVTETRPGVGIDAATGANAEHVFFQAQYLRLREREGVGMTAFAACVARKASGTETDVLGHLFAANTTLPLQFGGQQGIAYVEALRTDESIPLWREQTVPIGTTRIKWVLLSPAVFNAGWRPDWVDADGAVCLVDAPERSQFASRTEWRQAIHDAAAARPIAASLVAARIPGAVPFSGWSRNMRGGDEQKEVGAKRTLLAVPAGSVYYFKATSPADAAALVRQLHGRARSSRYGESGLGLGVCGRWDFMTMKEESTR